MTSDSAAPSTNAVALLSLCDVFSEVDPAVLALLDSHAEVVLLERGQVLIRAGDPADCIYTVVSGRLRAFTKSEDGDLRFLAEIGPGETVGEAALIDPEPRATTVRCARDCQLVRLSRAGFEIVVRQHPEIMAKVARVALRRLHVMESRPAIPAFKSIAIIPAGESLASADFAAQLCRIMNEFGSTLHLTKQRFEQMFGLTSFDPDSAVIRRLSDLDSSYRFIILEAESTLTPWSRLCLRSADRILAVGNAGSSPELNEVENHVLATVSTTRIRTLELVLLQRDSNRIFAGTMKWLLPRRPLRHHHVRLSAPGDMRRLARIISGRAIGLTLGGGGARGLAHIGVIRAIQEARVPVDMIGGVSMGSIIAGQYAMGADWQTILGNTREHLVRGGLNSDLTLPLISITRGRKLHRALDRFFQDAAIEDLALNYFCTSCSLTTRELIVHRNGPLQKCIRASNALPGILPPVLHEGHVLIDGGILNNQPGDIMKELCGGQIIVSNVSPRTDLTMDASHAEMPSPWRVLWSRLNPYAASIRAPRISETLMRTLLVASDRKSREVESAADFYLRPALGQFRLEEWSKIDQIVDTGYECAKREIAAWQAAGKLLADAGGPSRAGA